MSQNSELRTQNSELRTQNSELRTQPIRSLTGIKVLALFLIFYQHSSMPLLPFGLGSRMCELLFVISGFLVGYNKYNKQNEYTWSSGVNYVVSKLIIFYPLHAIMVTFRCILGYNSFIYINTWIKLILSLLLVTPWFPNEEVFFSFNGSSWFLSSLLFCYFLSPFFIRLMKSKKSLVLFVIVFFIRFAIDFIQEIDVIFVTLHTHVNPFVRCLEFFMGILLVPTFFSLKKNLENVSLKCRGLVFSVLEISLFIFHFYVMYAFLDIWFKSFYVLFFCLYTFIFAFDEGVISKILGFKLFKKINSIQFEFYLSHTTFLAYCNAFLSRMNIENLSFGANCLIFIFEFFILTFICIIYNKFLKNFFSRFMKVIFSSLYSFFGYKKPKFLY